MADSISIPSTSVYDAAVTQPPALISAQVPSGSPTIDQLLTGTDLLVADKPVMARLDHFPEDLYDLRPESHLVRFLGALLGDAGAGQLRKRNLIVRIQQVLDSAAFFDLDGFYGAIFGVERQPSDVLPINPYTENETPDEWDSIFAADSRYRERIMALAAAIPMAATVPGIRMAAEALVGAECDVYEIWRFIDVETGSPVVVDTWDDIEAAYATWDDIDGVRWSMLSLGEATIGNLDVTTAAEVIVRVKKEYPNTRAGMQEKAIDEMALVRVLRLLRSANTVITVDNQGISMHSPCAISSLHADSEFWEITTKVAPNGILREKPGLYPLAPSQKAAGVEWGEQRTVAKPPLVVSQGYSWEHASSVVNVRAAAMEVTDPDDLDNPGEGVIIDPLNYQRVEFRDGSATAYSAERGSSDPRTVQGGLAASSGMITAAPYSAPRTTVGGAP